MAAHSKDKITINNLPTAPASAVRLRFFQHSCRPVLMSTGWLETPWGRCMVEGRLGQPHADLLDAIMHTATKVQRADDGRIHLLVDPFDLRRCLGSTGQYSGQWLTRRLCELRTALVQWESTIRTKDGTVTSKGIGGIVDSVVETKITKNNPLTKRSRTLMGITISAVWAQLIADDIGLYYDPVAVIRLHHGISKSVARP